LVAYGVWGTQTENDALKKVSHSSSVNTGRPNIILLTFDALTARNMSVYGYHRETTPFITEWSKNASTFTMAEAASTYTAPTIASLMTGKRVWTHQLYQPHGYKIINASTENLPLLLRNRAYYTMALIQNTYASAGALGISDAFDIFYPVHEFVLYSSITKMIDYTLNKFFAGRIIIYDWIIRGDFIFGRLMNIVGRFFPDLSKKEYPPEKIFNKFLWIVQNRPPEPFFAWIHLMPPHDPYIPPEPYMGMYDSSPRLRTHSSQNNINKRLYIETTMARYDEFIRYCDEELNNFIKELMKYVENTVIILSSDHGESFEHNIIGHGGVHLYEQLTHIPLIIKEPGQIKGRLIHNPVEQIDIPATILDLAHITIPEWMEGQSLVPLVRGERIPSKPVFSMALGANYRLKEITGGSIAVWEDDYKLIYYFGEEKSQLFNLKQDPDELYNLFDKEPERSRHLLSLIQENLNRANRRISK
jgi:arylsulfatase A-like enzyme